MIAAMNHRAPSRRHVLRLACATGLASITLAAPAVAQSFGRITVPADKIRAGVDGLDNFYRVDARVFRAHKPTTAEAYGVLSRRFGVRTIVDLRNRIPEPDLGPGASIRVVHAPMETFDVRGSEAQVVRALAAIHQGQRRGRVLVHCDYGRDRTGTVIALYHMMFHGWSRERALTDMIAGPFEFHEFLTLFPPGHSIHGYVEGVDVADMKRRVLAMGPV